MKFQSTAWETIFGMDAERSMECAKKCHIVESVGIPAYNVARGIEGGTWEGAMPDHTEKGDALEVTCPCCEARLTVDPASGAVLGSEKAAHARAGVDLKDAVVQRPQNIQGRVGARLVLLVPFEAGEKRRQIVVAEPVRFDGG